MLREHDGIRFWLSIISARRPENVPKMSELVGAATWYTDPESTNSYRQQGISQKATFGLSAARNLALQDAESHDAVCVQLDDDLKWTAYAVEGKKQEAPPFAVIANLVRRLEESDFYLGGISPTDNPYFATKNQSTNLFVIGSFCAVKPGSGLYFDTSMKLKEDYDYTCQHIEKFGGVMRCDNLLASFSHYSNSGGAVDIRNEFTEQEVINYLIGKWPGWIKKHPRRKNEVLLQVRRQRAVLS